MKTIFFCGLPGDIFFLTPSQTETNNFFSLALAQIFFCKFSEISRNNFFIIIEHIRATAFGLSFVNPRKKSEGTSLVKFLQSCHFNIK